MIKLEKLNDHLALITLSRPEALNALNLQMLNRLNEIIDEVMSDKTIKVVILTGEGKAFVAGADIEEMLNMKPHEAREFSLQGQALFRKIETMEKPVIAAVNGFALGGGCELMMSCDIRIASEKSKFGQPEVGLGIPPGFAGTQRLPRIVGMAKAKELIFTGDIINAEEAKKILLINHVVKPEELLPFSIEMANKIISKSSTAVNYSKAAINQGTEISMEKASEIEANLFALCFASEDQKEGMAAFLEKRKPNFER
ncbi:enoyl-CoA hydratase-related protein [Alkaliphilus peptidifermentans]|uniref:short-chain-enoyl-CoA hydratase n=1 Tax=Alkaliphilus peptidifermentans DSM 18978 TaxID=1120976 RepID=A0A1G5BHZ3_9FIRM|nr:enoyl-CoA hydratase-related protein [Alkaliphilus peptidifermentans]SCX89872.1 enoyl-CoA hydratase [Alkaliphilus peptidifermentans DSM 18978]